MGLSGFFEGSLRFSPKILLVNFLKTFLGGWWESLIYLHWMRDGDGLWHLFIIGLPNVSSHFPCCTHCSCWENSKCLTFQSLTPLVWMRGASCLCEFFTPSSHLDLPATVMCFLTAYLWPWLLVSRGRGLWHLCHCMHVVISSKVGGSQNISICLPCNCAFLLLFLDF